MSCVHRWHGCGPSYDRGWYESCGRDEDADWPYAGRRRRDRQFDIETPIEALEMRLDELRGELRRTEVELARLSRPTPAAGEV